MENLKNFRKAICEAMKEDIKNLSKEQKILKNQRKEQNRPEGTSLWQIQIKINHNAGKITSLISFYRWAKHSMAYWSKRNVTNFNDLLFWGYTPQNDLETVWHYVKYKNEDVKSYIPRWVWKMYSGINQYVWYCKKYKIEYNIDLLQKILFNVR